MTFSTASSIITSYYIMTASIPTFEEAMATIKPSPLKEEESAYLAAYNEFRDAYMYAFDNSHLFSEKAILKLVLKCLDFDTGKIINYQFRAKYLEKSKTK